jgi:hypothetical protein
VRRPETPLFALMGLAMVVAGVVLLPLVPVALVLSVADHHRRSTP